MTEQGKKRSIFELTENPVDLILPRPLKSRGNRVHILALGDVGANVLLGLKTLGAGTVDTIGIYDINHQTALRYEAEMNQIGKADGGDSSLPTVEILQEGDLFSCDIFLFCASGGVPPIGEKGDVRMAQLEVNGKLAAYYGKKAEEAGFQGIFAVISDPVDPLCKRVMEAGHLKPAQVRGYGLGVMAMRARYFAQRDERFFPYLREGRAYGPHGKDLVIADSVREYDEALSEELTDLTVGANMKIRELGFKPFLAPAFSSAVLPVLATLRGEWHYSSVYMGNRNSGAFLGIRNRIHENRAEIEDLPLPEALYERIKKAYDALLQLK